MKDALCLCFTGIMSRLINCLNGFDERVQIKIADTDEISNIIIMIRKKYSDISTQKTEAISELIKRGYEDEVINEWIVYL